MLLLGAFVTFYMLEDGDRAWATAIGELEPWRVRLLSDRAVLTLQRLGGYLRGTVLLAMANALWAGAVLLLTGVPFAGPLATIALFARFVPYYGAIFADAVILVVTFALRGSGVAGLVLVLLLAGDVVLSRNLRSRAYGPAAAGVNPALVLIAVPFGGAVAGVLGMFAATPVVGVAAALGPAIRQALDTGPDSTADRALVPHWLDRLAQWSWRVLAVIAAGTLGIAAITVTSGVAVVIVIALILAIVFEPIVVWLGRKGIRRGLAALVTVGGSSLVLVALLVLTVSQLVAPAPGGDRRRGRRRRRPGPRNRPGRARRGAASRSRRQCRRRARDARRRAGRPRCDRDRRRAHGGSRLLPAPRRRPLVGRVPRPRAGRSA